MAHQEQWFSKSKLNNTVKINWENFNYKHQMYFTLIISTLNVILNIFLKKVNFLFPGKHGDPTMSIYVASLGHYGLVNASIQTCGCHISCLQ